VIQDVKNCAYHYDWCIQIKVECLSKSHWSLINKDQLYQICFFARFNNDYGVETFQPMLITIPQEFTLKDSMMLSNERKNAFTQYHNALKFKGPKICF